METVGPVGLEPTTHGVIEAWSGEFMRLAFPQVRWQVSLMDHGGTGTLETVT